MAPIHGSVILCEFKARWLVWGNAFLPIERHNVPRMRSDLPVKDGHSLQAMGLPAGQWLIRAANPDRVTAKVVIGRAPDSTMALLTALLRRECEARRIEASSRTSRPTYTETPVRL